LSKFFRFSGGTFEAEGKGGGDFYFHQGHTVRKRRSLGGKPSRSYKVYRFCRHRHFYRVYPNDHLVKYLAGKIPELYIVGDASKPREVMEAVCEAEEVALKI